MAFIENDNIILSYLGFENDGYLIRLYNASDCVQKSNVKIFSFSCEIEFTPYEVKTFLYENDSLKECNMLGELI